MSAYTVWIYLGVVSWLSAVGAGFLFCWWARGEIRLLKRRGVDREQWEACTRELIAEIESLRHRISEIEDKGALAPPVLPDQPLNLNRRGQILRLHGKGRSLEEIAADLQISKGEVQLVLRVNEWPRPELAL